MKITRSVIREMSGSILGMPPESGGILGSRDGVIIDTFVPDIGNASKLSCCSYVPNTAYFNDVIAKWQEHSIYFMGIYHSHFANVRTLSQGDITYIDKIMKAMPIEVKQLYFPIFTLPERNLTAYAAERGEVISIKTEATEIIG